MASQMVFICDGCGAEKRSDRINPPLEWFHVMSTKQWVDYNNSHDKKLICDHCWEVAQEAMKTLGKAKEEK